MTDNNSTIKTKGVNNYWLIVVILMFVAIFFSTGTYIIDEPLDVDIQDYFGELQSYYLIHITQETRPTTNINKDSNSVIVSNATGCLLGDAINIFDNVSMFQGIITNKVGSTLTFVSSTDKLFNTSNTYIECGEWNMNVNGAVTPVEYTMHPPSNINWHIESTNVKFIDNADMDSSTFGSRTALSNGYDIRITDGYDKSLFLIYNNVGFTSRGFDFLTIPKAPSGVYMQQYELIFEEKYGAIIQLKGSTGDMFKVTVRDDLTSQTEVSQVINAHKTSD